MQPEIEHLGHTIDKYYVRSTKAKIEAIPNSSLPTNIKELKPFLELIIPNYKLSIINFYMRLIYFFT